jgi:hypothetical protein
MTDDGRGLFDDQPPVAPADRATRAAKQAMPATPGKPATAPADADHIDSDEVQPRSAGIEADAALVDPPPTSGPPRPDDDG